MNNNNIPFVVPGKDGKRPYAELICQPEENIRFRYENEIPRVGVIKGRSHKDFKYPTIKVNGYNGPIYVIVSLVTKDSPYTPHPFKVYDSKSGNMDEIYAMELKNSKMIFEFSNLCIISVKKRLWKNSLDMRSRKNINPFNINLNSKLLSNIEQDCVRLCFQIYIPEKNGSKLKYQFYPIVSEPIYDKKCINRPRILQSSQMSDFVQGGSIIRIKTSKLYKNDIKIRFYKIFNEATVWEKYIDIFGPKLKVLESEHYFEVPKYYDLNIQTDVQVFYQIYRPSDDKTSLPNTFTYKPSLPNETVAVYSLDSSGENINQPAFNIDEKEFNEIIESLNCQSLINSKEEYTTTKARTTATTTYIPQQWQQPHPQQHDQTYTNDPQQQHHQTYTNDPQQHHQTYTNDPQQQHLQTYTNDPQQQHHQTYTNDPQQQHHQTYTNDPQQHHQTYTNDPQQQHLQTYTNDPQQQHHQTYTNDRENYLPYEQQHHQTYTNDPQQQHLQTYTNDPQQQHHQTYTNDPQQQHHQTYTNDPQQQQHHQTYINDPQQQHHQTYTNDPQQQHHQTYINDSSYLNHLFQWRENYLPYEQQPTNSQQYIERSWPHHQQSLCQPQINVQSKTKTSELLQQEQEQYYNYHFPY